MTKMKLSIPIIKPSLDKHELKAIRRPLLTGWVTQGPEVASFEHEFADYVEAKYACAVSSCTAALHMALITIGIKPNDEIITVSHSFIATANSIRYCEAIPVFVDIQPKTYNIDPNLIEKLITKKTRAILCVHQMGMPCDLKAILKIAHRHSLPIIEDAACAVGSEILWNNKWEKIGKPHGDIACFSFHPRKVITTGDGGMITTSNPHWDKKFRLLRQHGMNVPDTVRHKAKKIIFESYPTLGYNYRMTDIQAAIGREQLKKLPEIIKKRRFLAKRYKKMLSNISAIELPEEPFWTHSNWQSYCIRLPHKYKQQKIMQFMLDKGISTRRGIMCAHKERPYLTKSIHGNLKESEDAQKHCIIIPLYPQIKKTEQNYIVEILSKTLQKETV